jgi:hypothetical protein
MAIAVVLLLTMASVVQAQTGVQWSPDNKRIFVSKDIVGERWAITLNLEDLTATGNVLRSSGVPAFIWCDKIADNGDPNLYNLQLRFRCFGADLVTAGAFSMSDYNLISDNVVLPGSFFLPPPETCDLATGTNGPNAGAANSLWDCGDLQFQLFADGTGVSSAIGPFSVVQTGCASGVVTQFGGVQSFFTVLLSPSRGLLNVYQVSPDIRTADIRECHLIFF